MMDIQEWVDDENTGVSVEVETTGVDTGLVNTPTNTGTTVVQSPRYVQKELNQMHDTQTYTPIETSTLSEAERKDAINQLMFMIEKRCGKIKARSCVDGRKQREYIKKEDASSPTVSLEAIMLTMAIEAAEGREVATIDIPGAFLHADIDEDVLM